MPKQVKTDYDIISQKYLHSDFDTLGNAFFRGDFLFVGGYCWEKFPPESRFALMDDFKTFIENFVSSYVYSNACLDVMKPLEKQSTAKLAVYPLQAILENYYMKMFGSLPVDDEIKLQQMRLQSQWNKVKASAKQIMDGIDKYKVSCYRLSAPLPISAIFYDISTQIDSFVKDYIDYSSMVGSYEKSLFSI